MHVNPSMCLLRARNAQCHHDRDQGRVAASQSRTQLLSLGDKKTTGLGKPDTWRSVTLLKTLAYPKSNNHIIPFETYHAVDEPLEPNT